jgi:hypothetical protein
LEELRSAIHSATITAVSSSFVSVGAGFIPARSTGCLAERVGIKLTPTDGDDVERYMHQLMRYVYFALHWAIVQRMLFTALFHLSQDIAIANHHSPYLCRNKARCVTARHRIIIVQA